MQTGLKLFKLAMDKMVTRLEMLESVMIKMPDDELYILDYIRRDPIDAVPSTIRVW